MSNSKETGARPDLIDGRGKYPNKLTQSERLYLALTKLGDTKEASSFGYDQEREEQIKRVGASLHLYEDIAQRVALLNSKSSAPRAPKRDLTTPVTSAPETHQVSSITTTTGRDFPANVAVEIKADPKQEFPEESLNGHASVAKIETPQPTSIRKPETYNHIGNSNGNSAKKETKPDSGQETLDILPENERMFYIGLGLANFQTETLANGSLVLITKATKGNRRELLKGTIGTRAMDGKIYDKRELRINLDSNLFYFYKDPPQSYNVFLLRKETFDPFAAGLLTGSLSETGRLSLPDLELLGKIFSTFEQNATFSMGKFWPKESEKRPTPVIEIKHQSDVYNYLLAQKTVKTLPFYNDLKAIWTAKN